MQLRPATEADASALGGLALLVWLHTYATDGLRADLTEEALATGAPDRLLERLREAQRRVWLAERQGHVTGLAELRLDGAQAELERLYLHPRFQRQGGGRALLQACEQDARAAGAVRLWLSCWSGNTPARAFYARCGYIDEGAMTYRFGGSVYENRRFAKTLG